MGVVIGLSLILFWNMLATYEGGEFIEVNETDANYTKTTIVLLHETVCVDLGKYHVYGVQARRGDNLNITVEVLDDGGINRLLHHGD